MIGDMTQCIGSLITKFGGIRRTADADGIENEEKDAAHFPMRSITQGAVRFGFPST